MAAQGFLSKWWFESWYRWRYGIRFGADHTMIPEYRNRFVTIECKGPFFEITAHGFANATIGNQHGARLRIYPCAGQLGFAIEEVFENGGIGARQFINFYQLHRIAVGANEKES